MWWNSLHESQWRLQQSNNLQPLKRLQKVDFDCLERYKSRRWDNIILWELLFKQRKMGWQPHEEILFRKNQFLKFHTCNYATWRKEQMIFISIFFKIKLYYKEIFYITHNLLNPIWLFIKKCRIFKNCIFKTLELINP